MKRLLLFTPSLDLFTPLMINQAEVFLCIVSFRSAWDILQYWGASSKRDAIWEQKAESLGCLKRFMKLSHLNKIWRLHFLAWRDKPVCSIFESFFCHAYQLKDPLFALYPAELALLDSHYRRLLSRCLQENKDLCLCVGEIGKWVLHEKSRHDQRPYIHESETCDLILPRKSGLGSKPLEVTLRALCMIRYSHLPRIVISKPSVTSFCSQMYTYTEPPELQSRFTISLAYTTTTRAAVAAILSSLVHIDLRGLKKMTTPLPKCSSQEVYVVQHVPHWLIGNDGSLPIEYIMRRVTLSRQFKEIIDTTRRKSVK
jgi:hypothetical protein